MRWSSTRTRKAVIHRDIKPSNLLIDTHNGSQPILKVIDFGIAKIIDTSEGGQEAFTTVGERFGTPAYMSPEQSQNCFDVDTRSDVYSLGVVLFEMLTGENPFAVQRSLDQKDSLSGRDPSYTARRPSGDGGYVSVISKPSELLRSRAVSYPHRSLTEWRQLRGDLDAIVMKAIAKDRNRRYQSVQELRRDLDCFLAGKPVEAVGPTPMYQLKKYVERHRFASAVVLLLLLIIISSSIVSTSFAIHARRSEERFKQQLHESLILQRLVEQERIRRKQLARERSRSCGSMASPALWMKHPRIGQASAGDKKSSEYSGLKYLYEPNQRLIAQSDWSWTEVGNLQEFRTVSCDMTSQDIAALMRQDPQNTETWKYETPLPQSACHYNEILLGKLAKLVPANDPLVAEILDNLALCEQDAGKFQEAERHFEAASDLWKKFSRP